MSFLRDYLDYASGNEAPEMFHVWAGYTCLSAAISRRVWLPHGDQAIFPNIYVMLVGDAGNGKSEAMRKAKRLLAELETVPISRSVETPEGLWRFMNGEPNGNPPVESPVAFPAKWPDGQIRECHPMTIIANEFINFIGLNQQGWTNALNDIYDEDRYEYRTKNKGEDNLIGPYIVLLGALTTEVSSDLQKARIIASGFARRTLFQYGERKWNEPHPVPEYTQFQQDCRKRAVFHAKGLQKVAGAFTQTEEAVAWWDEWYREHSVNVPKQEPQIKSWHTSKPHQVIKIAMLTSLSESYDLVLKAEHLQVALEYINLLETDLFKVFGGVGRNELAAVAMKIYDFVSGLKEPLSRRRLKSTFWGMCKPPNDFDECFTFLCNEGKIASKFLQIGSTGDDVVATPQVLAAFEARVKQLPPPDATPSDSRPDAAP
jgi:hypothetical protein